VPTTTFIFPANRSGDVETPSGIVGTESDRVEGDGNFAEPTIVTDLAFAFPDRVPIAAGMRVVVD
jgi:hypothetical protein